MLNKTLLNNCWVAHGRNRGGCYVPLQSSKEESTVCQNLWGYSKGGLKRKVYNQESSQESESKRKIHRNLQRLRQPPNPANQKKEKTQTDKIGDGKVSVTTDPCETQRISRAYFEILYSKKKTN